jgi:hypothetical protein
VEGSSEKKRGIDRFPAIKQCMGIRVMTENEVIYLFLYHMSGKIALKAFVP